MIILVVVVVVVVVIVVIVIVGIIIVVVVEGCRGLSHLSGLGPASGELGLSSLAEEYTRAEVSGKHVRQRSIPEGLADWKFTSALATPQHPSRLSAPARQLGCRRD